METVTPEGLQALKHRALQGILVGGHLGKAYNVAFFQGQLNALNSIQEGFAWFAARRDASLGGYQPLAGFEAAWAALPAGIEYFTLAEVQEFLRSKGVELSPDAVSNSQLNGVFQVEDGKVAALDGNDESQNPRVDANDGSGLHKAPPPASIVAQGGAA